MLQVTFPEIARTLETLSAATPAAETHGCLCGALCMSAAYSIERWFEEIIPEPQDIEEGERRPLGLLFTDTVDALRGEQMDFQPLLPDDQEALEQRAIALAQWCQGFLYGFGSCQPARAEPLPPDVQEILRDFTHIGQAIVDVGESGEEEEQAYAEVVEYVRAGVQLIHDELAEARERDWVASAAGAKGSTSDTDDAGEGPTPGFPRGSA
ncbi:MAG TPA: UPF0149 family protein [Steroidobacter sp.]|jgi:uncharacterized protein YgfB (UPF0149 family)|nr:UPF0149 family protein [Steroidobacteraceae bacterium]HLS81052.1 UPF0149 family protein [Steroidobacter sp.]